MNTVVVWYLLVFGVDHNTSQLIPQVSREQCVRNAAFVEDRIGQGRLLVHALCIEGISK